jgi:hypothetical protein
VIRKSAWYLLLLGAAAVFMYFLLAGCGGKATPAGPPTVDAEDYRGGPQAVASWDYEPDVTSTRTKRVADGTERYCTSRKNGACKSYGTRTKYENVTESYVSDDADWYLVLADGTRVDVDQQTQANYPVGAMYP